RRAGRARLLVHAWTGNALNALAGNAFALAAAPRCRYRILASNMPLIWLLSMGAVRCPGSSSGFIRCLPSVRLMEGGTTGDGAAFRGRRQAESMPKILLAEDDTDMRRFLVKALQNAGYEVISYDNGLAAYQRLREEPFELLLTDIVMPEMDGIEL